MADTDAAQRLYFAHQLRIAHSAFEEFMASIGHNFGTLLEDQDFLLPIVKAESEYHLPLSPGQLLRIDLRLGRVGRSSFSLEYKIYTEDNALAGEVRTTHVHINRKTGKPEKLSPEVQAGLEPLK